jgi:hypothetical protein
MDGLSIHLALTFALLAHPDYHVREAVDVSRLPSLFLHVGGIAPDLQTRLRCSQEIELRHGAVIASIRPPNGQWPRLDVWRYIETDKFLMENDSFPDDWAWIFSENECCITPDAYRKATAAYVGHLVRIGRPRQEIESLLDTLSTKEAEIGPWEYD